MKYIFIVLSFGLLPLVFSQAINADKLMANLKTFSSDSLEGRGVMQPGGTMAQAFVEAKFIEEGLLPFNETYRDTFYYANPYAKKKYTAVNIQGYLEGTKFPDKYIVVSSHHDHLGIRDGKIFNGADDNASGTCALFSMIAYYKLNPPKHSIIFVAFDGEEDGLKGSKHFVNKPPVALKSIVFNLNMDMISRNWKNEIYMCGTSHNKNLKRILGKIDDRYSIDVKFGHDTGAARLDDWTYASDHGSFHKKKIPFIYLGVEDHVDYHKATDDFDKVLPEFYAQAVLIAISIVNEVDVAKEFSK